MGGAELRNARIEYLLGKLSIFTGNANPQMAMRICESLDLPRGEAEVFHFPNENIFVKIKETVREDDVFVVQPLTSPVNTSIMEMLILIDALKRASAARITGVIPYYAYGRSDKKDQPRVPITARLLADLLTTAGAHRILTLDLHAGQIQGFFNIPVDELSAIALLSRYLADKHLDDPVVVAADLGAAKRARNFASRLDASLAFVEKRRSSRNDATSEALNIIGDVENRTAIVFDDEIDTAGTVTQAAKLLRGAGVLDILVCCVHGVFSDPAIERLKDSPITEIVTTDTVPLPPEKSLDKLTVLSVAPLLAQAIERIHLGGSVGELFV